MITGNTRSQDIPKRYRPNGAMYLNTRGNFIKNMNFYKNAKPYSMTLIDSIDIDNLLDFKIAEIIMKDIVNV
jgi:CMP-N-acetylneuraminic acid synthetase